MKGDDVDDEVVGYMRCVEWYGWASEFVLFNRTLWDESDWVERTKTH